MILQKSQKYNQKVAKILAESFIDDPYFEFIFGENENKFPALISLFELFIPDIIERGEIIIASEEQGACLWYPESVEIFNQQFEQIFINILSSIKHLTGEDASKRCEHLITKVGESEPDKNHCEVIFIGLKPEARGKGIGKHLIKPVINYADAKQVGCYLVSSNQRNISFYERNGFEKYFPIEISDSYSMTGMWRNAG